MRTFAKFLVSFCLLLNSSLFAQDAPLGAGCLFKINDMMIVGLETWSKKFSLPGGMVDAGEDPKLGAQRETFEEMGFQPEVGPEIARFSTFVLYRCYVRSPLTAVPNTLGQLHIRTQRSDYHEVESVLLINPSDYDARKWRFPGQAEELIRLYHEQSNQEDIQINIDTHWETNNVFEKSGLRLISWVQQWNGELLNIFFRFFSFLGEEYFFYMALPFIMVFFGSELGLSFVLFFLFSTLLNVLFKGLFHLPRPFDLEPSLQWMKASGFGFPSGHAQVSVVLWGWVALQIKSQRWRKILVSTMILTGLARIYFGVHFPHDVVGGWSIGALLLASFYQLKKADAYILRRDTLRWQWLLFAFAALPSLYLFFHPDAVALVMVWFSVLLGISFSGKWAQSARAERFNKKVFLASLLGMLGVMGVVLVFSKLLPENQGFIPMLKIRTLQFVTIGFWISLGIPWIAKKVQKN